MTTKNEVFQGVVCSKCGGEMELSIIDLHCINCGHINIDTMGECPAEKSKRSVANLLAKRDRCLTASGRNTIDREIVRAKLNSFMPR